MDEDDDFQYELWLTNDVGEMKMLTMSTAEYDNKKIGTTVLRLGKYYNPLCIGVKTRILLCKAKMAVYVYL